jgi:PAS domain-containing protein
VDNSRREGGRFEREYRVALPDGSTRWVHTRGGVDLGAGGEAILMRGVSLDITARKEAEELFRLVVEAAANGLIALDSSGRITLANARAAEIFGRSRRELGGLAITELVPDYPESGETAGRRKDGGEVALEIGLERVDLDIVPDIAFPFRQGIQIEEVAGLPVIGGRPLPLAGWNGVAKRTFDIVVSALFLLLLSPVLLACALAVRLESAGPVFYRQERMGRDRRVFGMLKFRSMRADAEARTGPKWADDDDPRRTRVGTFLRTWSLDELLRRRARGGVAA